MEPNDSNIKPQSTGGLKIMTVFVLVLVAHVVVLGSITAYYLLKGNSSDTELATDKNHKNVKALPEGATVGENGAPDMSTTPATPVPTAPAPAPVPSTEIASAPDTSAAPSATIATATPSAEPAPAPTPEPPATTVLSPAPQQIASIPAPAPEPQPAAAPSAMVPLVAETAPAPQAKPYIVKINDSFAKIARMNHTTVAKLKAANGITSDLLHAGQKLILPEKTSLAATTAAEATPVATTAKSPTSAPKINAVKTAAAKKAAASADKTASATAGVSDTQHHLYTVVKGDTLTKIAHRFNTTPKALMAANDIADATKLSIGKKLKIPSRESRSATNNPPAGVQPAQAPSKPSAPTSQLANNAL